MKDITPAPTPEGFVLRGTFLGFSDAKVFEARDGKPSKTTMTASFLCKQKNGGVDVKQIACTAPAPDLTPNTFVELSFTCSAYEGKVYYKIA